MIIYISLWKNLKKEKPNQPDYQVTAKMGEKFEEVGAGWIKKTEATEKFPEGRQFLSVKFKDGVSLTVAPKTTSDGKPIPFPGDEF